MTEFDINKLEGLHTASELLDKKYGSGTMARFCVTGVRN